MGSPISGDEGFDEEPFNPEGGNETPSSEKPFDDTPFDAGVEANEEDSPEKYIQQISGKLGQSLRKYTEELGQPDFDLEKFAINSVLSATNSGQMDQQDQSDIIAKVKSSSTTDGGANGGANGGGNDDGHDGGNEEPEGDMNSSDEEGLDLSNVDMEESHNPNLNGKTVFQNATLNVEDGGMEENKYLNLENTKKSSTIANNIKKMVKESLTTVEPQIAPKVQPQLIPERKTRRSQPYRIIPEQLPDPRPKAEKKKGEITYIKDSGFSEDGNSVTIKFDIDGQRLVANFLNSGELLDTPSINNPDEPHVYSFQTDITENGKQYYIEVSRFGHQENLDPPVFTDGDRPLIHEV